MPSFSSTPRIAASFTGWRYKEMREVIDFCEKNDPNPKDEQFIQELILDGLVRPELG